MGTAYDVSQIAILIAAATRRVVDEERLVHGTRERHAVA